MGFLKKQIFIERKISLFRNKRINLQSVSYKNLSKVSNPQITNSDTNRNRRRGSLEQRMTKTRKGDKENSRKSVTSNAGGSEKFSG